MARTINKIFAVLFLCIIATPLFVHGDAYDDASRALDSQIAELERTRDDLRNKLNTCEGKLKKNKIAGITTLSTTGAGVAGNVLLHKSIEKKSGGGGGGGNVTIGQDNRTDEETSCYETKQALEYGIDCDTVKERLHVSSCDC